MLGIFSENTLNLHVIWSISFFAGNMILQLLASIFLLAHPKYIKIISIYGFIASGINLSLVIALGNATIQPAIEWTTVFTALAFAGLIVINTAIKFKGDLDPLSKLISQPSS